MRALNYLELATQLRRSGIYTAASQQRSALADTDIELLESPWIGGGPGDAVLSGALGGRVFREFDLAHLHLFGPASLAVLRAARQNDVPLVLHAHTIRENTTESWRGVEHIAEPLEGFLRWFYSKADLVLCPSEYAKRCLESYPVSAPMEVLTNGVDLDALAGVESRRAEARAAFDLDGLVVFAVGNVFERKGLTTFCRLAEVTDYEFAWFGPYDRGPHASAAVNKWTKNPPENVTFTGWIDDIQDGYAAGDIFLFPTKEETQGITALEAMACGKAVVLRDIPVFEELYTHEHDCLKCETAGEFRAALERLEADPALRRRLGENGRETAANHSLERVRDRLTAIYTELTMEAQ